MEKINRIVFLLVMLFALGCSSKKSAQPGPNPVAATLIFPAADAACIIGNDKLATESTIPFNWESAANTNSYKLTIKNLLNGTLITKTTSGTTLNVTLPVNASYSWNITSQSNSSSGTVVSETWKFYNSGPGVTSYAPFPAEIIAPTMQQYVNLGDGKISLKWKGSDADNDITSYSIYFDTKQSPVLYKSGIVADSLGNVSIKSNTTYYWKVVTTDSQGNTSDSGDYSFTVN
ncbi:hypothetical protein KXD93_00895 [Mucilaginibacter sp. BJC16-A38]|uniref:hypothetical protein n=1 Tax=Mucilaginibacter phenanthrenivorans TaxID=1234842 RepID=UPI002157EC21|nr:hypothetical protein [Mucilaginibacter phenanthrenivorans]MCR8556176.1 hypothetical protein [Mucilaginibacter phenanthrenivorans]